MQGVEQNSLGCVSGRTSLHGQNQTGRETGRRCGVEGIDWVGSVMCLGPARVNVGAKHARECGVDPSLALFQPATDGYENS